MIRPACGRRAACTALVFALLAPLSSLAACGGPSLTIGAVQGDGDRSPYVGKTVTVEGLLTRDSRRPGGFRGLYLQAAVGDGNPATSDALFVYTRRSAGEPGQRLRVSGTIKEFHGLTELASVTALTVCGDHRLPLPEPITLNPEHWQSDGAAHSLERLENMRVRLPAGLVITDTHNLARYGELTLAPRDPVTPTEYQAPVPGLADGGDSPSTPLLLDDGQAVRFPSPIPWLTDRRLGPDSVRAGDTLPALTGLLDFRFGHWRIQPDGTPEPIATNDRPSPPKRPKDATVRVVAMNVENLFNGDGRGGGFPTPRGADTQRRYQRQQAALVAALTGPDPDILALSELENDGYGPESSVATLAQALGPDWRMITTPGQDGSDAIRTVLLYRADRVQPDGSPRRLRAGAFAHRGRPPLVQAFRPMNGGRSVQVVAVHFKSKACGHARGADADQGDGQGCFAHTRSEEARSVLNGLAALPPAPRTLVTGDFNSYTRETPLSVFTEAGWGNLVARRHPCTPADCRQYSYRFRGHKGSLDHALASPQLQPDVRAASIWTINADEPEGLPSGTPPGPWRSSDHNPLIIDLAL